jgi:hypothetical protein
MLMWLHHEQHLVIAYYYIVRFFKNKTLKAVKIYGVKNFSVADILECVSL